MDVLQGWKFRYSSRGREALEQNRQMKESSELTLRVQDRVAPPCTCAAPLQIFVYKKLTISGGRQDVSASFSPLVRAGARSLRTGNKNSSTERPEEMENSNENWYFSSKTRLSRRSTVAQRDGIRARIHPSSISYQVIEHLSVFVLECGAGVGSAKALCCTSLPSCRVQYKTICIAVAAHKPVNLW